MLCNIYFFLSLSASSKRLKKGGHWQNRDNIKLECIRGASLRYKNPVIDIESVVCSVDI